MVLYATREQQTQKQFTNKRREMRDRERKKKFEEEREKAGEKECGRTS